MPFKSKYEDYLVRVNTAISDFFDKYNETVICKDIFNAAEYAVKNGGKRVRPVMCLAAAEMLNISEKEAIKYALAIEFIHSYSLVHDDLPSMDNDDYRRGKLSTHKKFGEAMGILVGDALLNLSAEVLLSGESLNERELAAARLIFEYSGMKGMIAGQVFDIESEKNKNPNEEFLFKISENKTAKLITAPLLVPAILSGKYIEELKKFGKNLGILFQITDDIFDATGSREKIGKTPKKDLNKTTAITVFGLDGAKKRAEIIYAKCQEIISSIPNSDFLCDFTDFIYQREF